ncbi:signal transduction histidine kinase/ligand-binding sensor domain-containing protein [Duganella sp. 1224]|uniref:sensor histidine kinase n=1 Tax=Duganella sp. 1224 TaxID=2587052 RepID=UPI0015CB8A17|nr:sensor histidine kinase [Duganella sp. 1224]NYE59936.1 signal transduction histidine kinase/ligand-binding sensor domain-containing protein [Duganella sp. 1224]
MQYLRALLLTLLLCWLQLAAAAPARAPLLADFNHKAWGAEEDVPMDVMKFAQTADGWLWIATSNGLWRFDGARFERVSSVYGHPLKSELLMGINTTADGALIVGYLMDGISVFRPASVQSFTDRDGLPSSMLYHIEPAANGAMWVATRGGAAYLPPGGTRFQALGADAGLPALPHQTYQVLLARDGAQWIATADGVFFRRAGARRFQPAWPRAKLWGLAEAPDGTLWGADQARHYYRIATTAPADPAARPQPAFDGRGICFDRRGNMWVAHDDALERKLSLDGHDASQFLTVQNGLSGTIPGAMFEDREGNLWVGTSTGVDRIRAHRFRTAFPGHAFEQPQLLPAPDGSVWLGGVDIDLSRLDAPAKVQTVAPLRFDAAAWDSAGGLWFANKQGLHRRAADGTVSSQPLPYALRDRAAQAIQPLPDGAVWISYFSGDLYKVAGGQWIRNGGLAGLPDAMTTVFATGADQAIWVGHANGTVTLLSPDGVRILQTLGKPQGLNVGTVYAIYRHGADMWIGGEQGLFVYRQGRFSRLTGQHGERFRSIADIALLANGDLWLNGSDGVYHIAATELAGWLAGRRAEVDFERFGFQDGIRGRPIGFFPSLAQGPDGTLWIATANGVTYVDPARLARNPLPPPVLVRGVDADGRHYPLTPGHGAALALPAGSREMAVAFTALSLSIPERVRFRYRLLGLTDQWQEVKGRREAFYTNLAPGDYRFEVSAANEDGVWATHPATLDIRVAPTFMQTPWFYALLCAAVAACAYGIYLARIRLVTRQLKERFVGRMAERARIARALHDTLLQSAQALILSFQSSARTHAPGTPERERIERTLDLAEKLLAEGRDQIMDLRATAAPDEVVMALKQFGKEHTDNGKRAFSAHVSGKPVRLRPGICEEVYAIGREALYNAARHAEARNIWLELRYRSRHLTLTVRDDGRGIDADVLRDGQRDGHWGLVGMRERAAAIGAQLTITSTPGKGTTVAMVIAARNAYLSD